MPPTLEQNQALGQTLILITRDFQRRQDENLPGAAILEGTVDNLNTLILAGEHQLD